MEPKDQERVNALLDRALDEYGKAEPRIGLENRVLAHLNAERNRRSARLRWWWARGAAAAVATVGFAVWLASGTQGGTRSNEVAKTRPASVRQESGAAKPPEKQAARNSVPRTLTRVAPGSRGHYAAPAAAPKLGTFPSPAPLSEQEQLLARCVTQYPREALMMAKSQAEVRQRQTVDEASPNWWEQKSGDSKK